MQKMMNKLNSLLKRKMSIGTKITLLYTAVFSVSFIVLTIFIMLNVWYYYEDVSKNEIEDTIAKVSEHIKAGNEINFDAINELKPHRNIEIRIFESLENGQMRNIIKEPPKQWHKNSPDDIQNNLNQDFWERKPSVIIGEIPLEAPPNKPPRTPIIKSNDDENTEKESDNNSETSTEKTHIDEFPLFVRDKTDFEQRKERFETETVMGVPYMLRRSKVEYNGKQYFVEVFRTNKNESDVLQTFAFVFIIANLLGICASFGIGRFISKKILNPISEITKTAESITVTGLNQRISVPNSNDEIANLADTFNDMIERLEISFEKQKEFISNASHELKTPISVIQGYASLISRWGKSDPEVLQESIDSIKDETEYMSNLIKKLLFIAKNEQNLLTEKKELSINNVALEVTKETSVLDIKGEFTVTENEDVFILGDFNLIKQLLWVFIENAIKYTDKDFTKVNIDISKDDKNAILKISDNGIGIKQEDIPYIFDRFFRGDKSHNKTISGNGLGLSIAQIIVKQLDGEIEVFSEEKKGTTFVIKFPLL